MAEETSFNRWQGRTLEQFGSAINLLLSLSLATIGFVVSKLFDKAFSFSRHLSKMLIMYGSYVLLFSTVLFLFVTYNRLFSFKKTTSIARKRETNQTTEIADMRQEVIELDKTTWRVFKCSMWAFCIGEIAVIVGFLLELC